LRIGADGVAAAGSVEFEKLGGGGVRSEELLSTVKLPGVRGSSRTARVV